MREHILKSLTFSSSVLKLNVEKQEFQTIGKDMPLLILRYTINRREGLSLHLEGGYTYNLGFAYKREELNSNLKKGIKTLYEKINLS